MANSHQEMQNVVIPEDDGAVTYSNVYISSSSVSSSSLDGEDDGHNHDCHSSEKISYPQDLLGLSWGSYLHSGPPTRAGEGQTELHIDSEAHFDGGMTPQAPINIVTTQPTANVQSILRTHPIKAVTCTQPLKPTHAEKTVKIMCNNFQKQDVDNALMLKLRDLIKSLSDCREMYNLETIPVPDTLLSALKDCAKTKSDSSKMDDHDLKGVKDVESTTNSNNKLLHEIVEYLKETVERLAQHGRKLNEQAAFLQRTGRQLGRNHQSLLEEQAMLELASEKIREQLEKEKEDLEAQKEQLRVASEQIEAVLKERRQHGPHNRMSSPHTIAQGRSQLVALKRTQKEQSRLERIFLEQQREIRKLQREQMSTKSDLLATKEHAERLQHKLEEQVIKLRKSTVFMTSYTTYENRGSQEKTKQKEKLGIDKLLANQRTLANEVERMRRQLADQQKRERHLLHQQDSRHQLLKETGTKLKWQTAAVRGGYDYTEYRRAGVTGKGKKPVNHIDGKLSSPYKLPVVGSKKVKKTPLRPQQEKQKVSLPVLTHSCQLPPEKVQLLHHHFTIPIHGTLKRKKPKFTFSKSELESLACFRDDEVAKQVLKWLDMQGQLSDT